MHFGFIARANHRQIADGQGGPIAVGVLGNGINGIVVRVLRFLACYGFKGRAVGHIFGLEQPEFHFVHVVGLHERAVQIPPLLRHLKLDQIVGDGAVPGVFRQIQGPCAVQVAGVLGAEEEIVQRGIVGQGIALGGLGFHDEVGHILGVGVNRSAVQHVVELDFKSAVQVGHIGMHPGQGAGLGRFAVLIRGIVQHMLIYAEFRPRQLQGHVGPVHFGDVVAVLHIVVDGEGVSVNNAVNIRVGGIGNRQAVPAARHFKFKFSVAVFRDLIVGGGLNLRNAVAAHVQRRKGNAGILIAVGNGEGAVGIHRAFRIGLESARAAVRVRVPLFQKEFRAIQVGDGSAVVIDFFDDDIHAGFLVGIGVGNIHPMAALAGNGDGGVFIPRARLRCRTAAYGIHRAGGGDVFISRQGGVGFTHSVDTVHQVFHGIDILSAPQGEIGVGEGALEIAVFAGLRFRLRNGIAVGVHFDGVGSVVGARDFKGDAALIRVRQVSGRAHEGFPHVDAAQGGPVVDFHDIAAVVFVNGVIRIIRQGEAIDGVIPGVGGRRSGFLQIIGNTLLQGEAVFLLAGLDRHIAVRTRGVGDGLARGMLMARLAGRNGVQHGIAAGVHQGKGNAPDGLGHIARGVLVHPDGVDVEARFTGAGDLGVPGAAVAVAVHGGRVVIADPLAGIADHLCVVADDHLFPVRDGKGALAAPIVIGHLARRAGILLIIHPYLDGRIVHRQRGGKLVRHGHGVAAVQFPSAGIDDDFKARGAMLRIIQHLLARFQAALGGRRHVVLHQSGIGIIDGHRIVRVAPCSCVPDLFRPVRFRDGACDQGFFRSDHIVNDLVAGQEVSVPVLIHIGFIDGESKPMRVCIIDGMKFLIPVRPVSVTVLYLLAPIGCHAGQPV